MSRTIDSSTLAAMIAATVYECWLIRLDVVGDPLYIHTGLGDLSFAGGLGYDANLVVGTPFKGVGNIGQIDPITDGISGSQSVNLVLPAVDTSLDYLHQFVTNGDLWQRRQGWIWYATLDSNGALVGKPIRIKTGRMDKLLFTIDPENGQGTLSVTIESQQAWSSKPLFSRYIEQKQIDATDTSQDYTANLANKVPNIGNNNTDASGSLPGGRGTLPNKYNAA